MNVDYLPTDLTLTVPLGPASCTRSAGRSGGRTAKLARARTIDPARLAKKKSRHARALNRLGVKGPLRVHSAVVVAAKRITNYVAPVSQGTR